MLYQALWPNKLARTPVYINKKKKKKQKHLQAETHMNSDLNDDGFLLLHWLVYKLTKHSWQCSLVLLGQKWERASFKQSAKFKAIGCPFAPPLCRLLFPTSSDTLRRKMNQLLIHFLGFERLQDDCRDGRNRSGPRGSCMTRRGLAQCSAVAHMDQCHAVVQQE